MLISTGVGTRGPSHPTRPGDTAHPSTGSRSARLAMHILVSNDDGYFAPGGSGAAGKPIVDHKE